MALAVNISRKTESAHAATIVARAPVSSQSDQHNVTADMLHVHVCLSPRSLMTPPHWLTESHSTNRLEPIPPVSEHLLLSLCSVAQLTHICLLRDVVRHIAELVCLPRRCVSAGETAHRAGVFNLRQRQQESRAERVSRTAHTRRGLTHAHSKPHSAGDNHSATITVPPVTHSACLLWMPTVLFDEHHREVGTIMRYLGAYPSESDLVTVILPALQPTDSSPLVPLTTFLPFMLHHLLAHTFDPDSETLMLAAFRVLDVDRKGYIDESTLVELLSDNEWGFREKEMEDFLRVAKDPDTGFIHYEGRSHCVAHKYGEEAGWKT